MKLAVKEVVFPKLDVSNFEELKAEITEKATLYKNMVYTEATIKEAKADRASLNKFVAALEDKRKEIKKQCLEPYEAFEKQIKELVAIINEPVKLIDGQVKEYEQKKKEEKMEQLTEFWNASEPPEWLEFGKIFDQRWLNASYSLSKATFDIGEILTKIYTDIKTLEDLPEFSFEAIECYKETLDLNTAISRGKALADIQKRKMEAEEAEAQKKPKKEKLWETEKQWVKFAALLSTEDAQALKQFCEDRKIEIKAI